MAISSNIERRKVKLTKPIDFTDVETGISIHFDTGAIFYNYKKPPMLEWQEWFCSYGKGISLKLGLDEYKVSEEPAPDNQQHKES